MKFFLLLCSVLLLMLLPACEGGSAEPSQTNISSELTAETDPSLIPINQSEPFIGRLELDRETEKNFYGTWKVEKLLCFANSWNDASEYPTGQNIIGDELIIRKDFFSSNGLKNYIQYQYELDNPYYSIDSMTYNGDSVYRVFKIDMPGLTRNDEVKSIGVFQSPTDLGIPGSFFMVNNSRLIFMMEATCFELKKIAD